MIEYIILTFKIEPEDGVLVALCPELGIVSQGDTIDEALSNIKDAAISLLSELEEFGEVDKFLSERGITKHIDEPLSVPAMPAERVEVRSGQIVSVLRALLGSQVALTR